MADPDCTLKFCNRCRTPKPLTEWNRDKNGKDGFSRVCKECARIASKEWREANRERHRAGSRELQKQYREANKTKSPAESKRCPQCKETKLAAMFHLDIKRFDGLGVWCIECTRAKDRARNAENRRANARQYYERNRGRINAKQKQFYAQNKELFFIGNRRRRARLKSIGGTHTIADIRRLLEHQKYRCVYCRCSIKTKRHIDHIVPLKLGGSNHWTNLQGLCPTCNLKKNAKHPIQYANLIGLLL